MILFDVCKRREKATVTIEWAREREREGGRHTPDLYNQVYVLCQGLNTVEAGNETDGNPSIRVHSTSQEKVTL